MKAVEENEDKLKRQEQFGYKTKQFKFYKTPLQPGEYVTNCNNCETTCHYPCGIADNEDKSNCSAMSNGICTACPGKCSWTKHSNNDYKYEHKECDVTITMDDLSTKYKFKSSHTDPKKLIQAHKEKLNEKFSKLLSQRKIINTKLEKISGNLQNQIGFIEREIDKETRNKHPGYESRITILQQLRDRAKRYL